VSPVVLVHVAVTVFLAGVIWTVQVVHYPLLGRLGPEAFVDALADHSRRITRLIAVPWALQGASTAWLLVRPPAGVSAALVWLLAVLAAIPVVVTVAASIPALRLLGGGFDAAVHARLLATNWLRTAAWTAHAAVGVVILQRAA
jgi:hypothetical protein